MEFKKLKQAVKPKLFKIEKNLFVFFLKYIKENNLPSFIKIKGNGCHGMVEMTLNVL